jgi:nucleotide-binding universal stress UspA family protein
MMYRSDSGAFASPLEDITDAGLPRARSPGHSNVHSLPPNACGIGSADIAERAVAPAEAVQARLFEAILLVEIVRLQDLARSMMPRWTGRGADQQWPPDALTELGARIEEVHRLLRALRDRFPYGPVVGGPSEEGLN